MPRDKSETDGPGPTLSTQELVGKQGEEMERTGAHGVGRAVRTRAGAATVSLEIVCVLSL